MTSDIEAQLKNRKFFQGLHRPLIKIMDYFAEELPKGKHWTDIEDKFPFLDAKCLQAYNLSLKETLVVVCRCYSGVARNLRLDNLDAARAYLNAYTIPNYVLVGEDTNELTLCMFGPDLKEFMKVSFHVSTDKI